jgi:uncharacterized protein (TIGR02001 family)
MKKIILSAAIFTAFASSAYAQQAEPASPHTFTGNVTVASDYRFRGISQTEEKPAIQGGFDYSHSSGFYVGNWNSNISGDFINDGSIEMDLYAGYKFEPVKDVTADVGILQYYYPGAEIDSSTDYDTTEVYVGASWKWLSAKYSYAVSDDVFGIADADGSWYLDLNGNFEIADKTTLNVHVGRQKFRGPNSDGTSYTDWKIGVARDFGFATLGLAYIDTNADDFYTFDGKELGDETIVLSVSKTF